MRAELSPIFGDGLTGQAAAFFGLGGRIRSDLDPILELHTQNDLWQQGVTVEAAPVPLRLLDELENHGESGLVREAALRANGAVAHGGESALDRVRRPQMLPVLDGKIVEGEQRVAIFLQTGGGLLVFRRVALDEGVERGKGLRLRLGHPDLLQVALGLRLLALRQLGEHVRRLVHPAALLAHFRPYFAGGLPKAKTTVGDGEFRPHVEPATLQVEQQAAPIVCTFPCAINKTDELLLALWRRPDQNEDALLLVLETRFEMDSIRPDVNVSFALQITQLPLRMILLPAVLKAADRARRKAARILAEQSGERLREIARRDAFQVEDRQQRLDRPRTAHVRRQERRRKTDPPGVVGSGLPIAHAWLTHGDRANAGHHLALGQMAVADDAGASIVGLERRMPGEELGHFGLDRLRQEIARATAQDFGELILEGPWLNQLDNVIV